MNPTDLPEPKHVQVKNAPKRIWLNVGDLWDVGHDEDVDFHDLGEVSWCDAKQDRDDIEYVRADESKIRANDLWRGINGHNIDNAAKRAEHFWKQALDGLHCHESNRESTIAAVADMLATFKDSQIADLRRQLDEAQGLYYELVYSVGNKYEGETRHQTALRYIRRAEEQPAGGSVQVEAARQQPDGAQTQSQAEGPISEKSISSAEKPEGK